METSVFEQPVKCPYCGGIMQAAVDAFQVRNKPIAGDLAICAFCQNLSVFNHDLLLEKANFDELDEKSQVLIRITQEVSKNINKKHTNRN